MASTMNLGEWTMVMRGPEGDEYPIAAGQLSASILPHYGDDQQVVVTVELAQFIRGIADQVEELAISGEVPDMTCAHDADDVYSPPGELPPCQ